MLFPSGNPFKCHEEVLCLQPMIPPKRFDIFSPLTEGCSEGLDVFRFFFKLHPVYEVYQHAHFTPIVGGEKERRTLVGPW